MHLATTSTPERNDPLWVDECVPGYDLAPTPVYKKIETGCEHLPEIIDTSYTSISAASGPFVRKVAHSVFSYYCAVAVWARLLFLQRENGLMLVEGEERFIDQVLSLNLRIPVLLAHYLSGIGNTRTPRGRDLRFQLHDDRPYTEAGGVLGWFGRISSETQFLYQNYPCLGVFAHRILVEFSDPAPVVWQLPEAIKPLENQGGPTTALIGYRPRVRVSDHQRHFNEGTGFNQLRFASSNPILPLNVPLLAGVLAELNSINGAAFDSMPITVVGSVGQLGYIAYDHELREGRDSAIYEAPLKLEGNITFSAAAFGYRVMHEVEAVLEGVDDPDDDTIYVAHAPWVIWQFPGGFRLDYVREGNALREVEPTLTRICEFRTTSFLVRSRLEELDRALNRRYAKKSTGFG
jgi:hypothetical protein